ncbi:MAG: toll/interleukin-1 receptor domain-containing protein, partial [Synergistaceae bacterium]|nr:toll/interleukin-1 receptor domain-containing protein [Synergistaceae bacterium]
MTGQRSACKVVPCSLEDESFVFVSYGHLDSEVVFPIIEGIDASGYSVWYDKGINISSTWTDEIAVAILNCKVLVVFLTKESAASSYVRSEIEFALNNRIRVIPVYLDGIGAIPPGLALGLNATQGVTDVDSPERVVEQICEALAYNKVIGRDKARDVKIEYKRRSKLRSRVSSKPLYAAVLLLAIAIAAVGWFFLESHSAPEDAQARTFV